MPKRKDTQSDDSVLAPNDPRRPLKIRRLTEERERIKELSKREPAIEDPEYDEWDLAVRTLLAELFDPSTYLIRFRKLTLRPISYGMGGHSWYSDPQEAWQTGLRQAEKILTQALEEAAIEFPPDSGIAFAERAAGGQTPVVVNIHNENIFSPTIHVTMAQVVQRLEALELSTAEKAIAREHLATLEEETRGARRWPVIGHALEGMKSLGKSVYKEVAVPLIVEFLKREAGITSH